MSEFCLSDSATHPAIYPHLCYSNGLGIVDVSDFACRDYTEDNYVLICMEQGCLICEQGEWKRIIECGEYLLLDKRRLHSYYFDPEIPSRLYWMHVNGDLAVNLVNRIANYAPLPFVGRNPGLFALLKQILLVHRQQSANPFQHSANVVGILCMVLEDAYRTQIERGYSVRESDFRVRVDAIFERADFSYTTLDELCTQMCMNKFYFSHLFKQYYGVSPVKYMNRLRLDRAKRMLLYSDMKVSIIARECGFSSSSYFAVAFRNEYGISPSVCRELKLTDGKESLK